jgi:two-component system, LytTR family, sensor kinase
MKNLISKTENFNRVEFWAATTIFVFIVFFHITDAITNSGYSTNDSVNLPFSYFFVSRLIQYVVLYLAFLFLNYYAVPKLLKKEDTWLNIFSIILVFMIIALIFSVSGTYMRDQFPPRKHSSQMEYYLVYQKSILYAAWLLLAFGFYSVMRYSSIYLLRNAESIESKYKFIRPATLVALIIWMIALFLILISELESEFKTLWAIVIPFSIILFDYCFHTIIPRSIQHPRKPFRNFLGKVFFILVLAYIPITLLGALLVQSIEGGIVISFFNTLTQLFLIAPISWVMFKRHAKGKEELHSLKKELGHSHANLDFLRSQINPHFLFNALNTIYGTALQEGAERTSSGIEKLGDMMRFMLQENMQEKIALSREVDYLENFISLQKLRTETRENIRINADIQQPVLLVEIAPMLLIPFVENAFKHGISFREPSYINISLEMRDKTLHFDVSNSKHVQQDSDPEKEKSGIGLDNVKQRLALVYPGRHQLVVRETKSDFFVHLSVEV